MKTLVATALFVALAASPAGASISVKRSQTKAKSIDVAIVREPLSVAVDALELHLPHRVQLLLSSDPLVSFSARGVQPEGALRALVLSAKCELVFEDGRYWVRDRREKTVTLDVKDVEIRTILKSMQQQCGIKNLLLDTDVQGKGTFMLTDVPCAAAFDIVLRTMGLKSTIEGSSVVTVGGRRTSG